MFVLNIITATESKYLHNNDNFMQNQVIIFKPSPVVTHLPFLREIHLKIHIMTSVKTGCFRLMITITLIKNKKELPMFCV